jgi:hypothetical protein
LAATSFDGATRQPLRKKSWRAFNGCFTTDFFNHVDSVDLMDYTDAINGWNFKKSLIIAGYEK